MNRYDIGLIASLLTADPDVFCEDMSGSISASGGAVPPTSPSANKPLTDLEIEKQGDEIGGNNKAGDMVADQMQMRQDIEKEQQTQRQRVLEPQFQELNDSMNDLQAGVIQGRQATQNSSGQLAALEKEMAGLNSLVGGLQKQV